LQFAAVVFATVAIVLCRDFINGLQSTAVRKFAEYSITMCGIFAAICVGTTDISATSLIQIDDHLFIVGEVPKWFCSVHYYCHQDYICTIFLLSAASSRQATDWSQVV
jgi:hypothetical protein